LLAIEVFVRSFADPEVREDMVNRGLYVVPSETALDALERAAVERDDRSLRRCDTHERFHVAAYAGNAGHCGQPFAVERQRDRVRHLREVRHARARVDQRQSSSIGLGSHDGTSTVTLCNRHAALPPEFLSVFATLIRLALIRSYVNLSVAA
jgi:hypothetical protein